MTSLPTQVWHPWIVVPTYNERENIGPLISAIQKAAPHASVLVVDDNSPDGTGRVADEIARDNTQVAVLHRAQKEGLGAAYRAGFREVLQDPDCDLIIQMDCDFSHDPAEIPLLLSGIDAGNDLVLGSRYVPGGSTPGWGIRRRLISKAGSLVARSVLRLPYRDLTGGFKAWRRTVLEQVDLAGGYAQGYGFQIEMTWTARSLGARIAEVPITFRDRTVGVSKMSGSIALEALLMVFRLRLRGPRASVSSQPATSLRS
jgi:dolichol-phosphate mannosyltransferase